MCGAPRFGLAPFNNPYGYGLACMTTKVNGPGLLNMFTEEEKKKRRVFFSFHYKNDVMRAAQIRNIGVLEGNTPYSDNDWETVAKNEDSIKTWISSQMEGRSCCVVLVGADTASRKWVIYEICEAWKKGLGVVGIYIHNVKTPTMIGCKKGENPFDHINFGEKKFSSIVKCYDPLVNNVNGAYDDIKNNISSWIEEAIKIRKKFN